MPTLSWPPGRSSWAPDPASDPQSDQEAQARGLRRLYLLAQTLCRYFALCTQPPNPLAGGYRQVAQEVLDAIALEPETIPYQASRALLESLDKGAQGVDVWIVDGWLIRVQHALDLEWQHGAWFGRLGQGLPVVGKFLRGEDLIAYELRLARDLLEEKRDPATAAELLARSVRAVGAHAVEDWIEAVKAGAPQELLDVLWIAFRASPRDADLGVPLARALASIRRPDLAFDILCRTLGSADKETRERYVAELSREWGGWGMPVPVSWDTCASQAMAAMQRGDFQTALPLMRWCDAQDPKNHQMLRNLGIAYARCGMVAEAMQAFASVNVDQGPDWAGQALREAKQHAGAVLALRYGSLFFRTSDQWLALGGRGLVRRRPGDDGGRLMARRKSWGRTSPGPQLNGYVTALYSTGQWNECARVSQKLLQVANGDPLLTACGAMSMAEAMLGLGHTQHALQHAQYAVQVNRSADIKAELDETLERARRGQVRTTVPLRTAQPANQAYAMLQAGEFAKVLEVGRTGKGPLLRAGVAAGEFRHTSDNDASVTRQALEVANAALATTAGSKDRDEAVARAMALRIKGKRLVPDRSSPAARSEAFPRGVPAKAGAAAVRPERRRCGGSPGGRLAGGIGTGGRCRPSGFPRPANREVVRLRVADEGHAERRPHGGAQPHGAGYAVLQPDRHGLGPEARLRPHADPRSSPARCNKDSRAGCRNPRAMLSIPALQSPSSPPSRLGWLLPLTARLERGSRSLPARRGAIGSSTTSLSSPTTAMCTDSGKRGGGSRRTCGPSTQIGPRFLSGCATGGRRCWPPTPSTGSSAGVGRGCFTSRT